jgi:hypothetical protein
MRGNSSLPSANSELDDERILVVGYHSGRGKTNGLGVAEMRNQECGLR